MLENYPVSWMEEIENEYIDSLKRGEDSLAYWNKNLIRYWKGMFLEGDDSFVLGDTFFYLSRRKGESK